MNKNLNCFIIILFIVMIISHLTNTTTTTTTTTTTNSTTTNINNKLKFKPCLSGKEVQCTNSSKCIRINTICDGNIKNAFNLARMPDKGPILNAIIGNMY